MKICKPVLIALLFISVYAKGQIINTIGGNGTAVSGGNGGQLANATFEAPSAVVFDASGNMYISDGHRVRKVATNGIITLIAGTGVAGYSGDGGPATAAQLNNPWGIAVDAAGNVFISEYSGNRIRKVSAGTGIITTYGGGGTGLNEGGSATGALISYPGGIVLDASGNLYVGCVGQNMVRKISTTGIITTVAGTGGTSYNGDNIPAITANISMPRDLSIDAAGNLYVIDYVAGIRKIATNGIITNLLFGSFSPDYSVPLLSGGIYSAERISVNAAGTKLYIQCGGDVVKVADITANAVWRYAGKNGLTGFSGDGGYAELAAFGAMDITLDATGALYIADAANYRLRKVTNSCPRPMQPGMMTTTQVTCDEFDFSIDPVPNVTSYAWTLPTGWTGAINAPAITALHTSYAPSNEIVTVSAVNNCGPGPTVEVSSAVPNINITITPSGPTTFCTNEQVLTLNGVPGQGVNNYNWMLNGALIPGATNPQYTVSQSGVYALKVNAMPWFAGCSDTSQPISVVINQAPNLQLTLSEPWPIVLCAGEQVTITAVNATGYTYQWMKDGIILPGATSNTYTATTEAEYWVKISLGSCIDTTGVDVTVNPVPSPQQTQILNSTSDNLCDEVPHLTQSFWGGWYQWKHNGVDIPGANNSYIDPTVVGSYTTVVTFTGTGCSSVSAPYIISATPVPVNITSSGFNPFCDGGNVILIADDSSNYTYQWQMNGVDIPGATNQTYSGTASGDYNVVIVQSNMQACTDASNSITLTEVPLPNPVITQNGNELSVPPTYSDYQWYLNGTSIPGATSNIHTMVSDGDYFVQVEDVIGCDGTSNTVTIWNTLVSGIDGAHLLKLYPNPFSESATLSISNPLHEQYVFTLYTVDGIKVRSTEFSTEALIIERKHLATGLYYYSVGNENGRIANGKLLIQ